jgi:intracellular sulfur oxidation DsrE/DsrF family protein
MNDAGAQVCVRATQLEQARVRFIPQAAFVPSGVAEITRLQQREGYACLRP